MKIGNYETHPAAETFPLLDGEAFKALVTSIKEHGLKLPVEIHRGVILDGRNRYLACIEAGVEATFRKLPDDVDPWEYAWAINVERRHIDEAGLRATLHLKHNERRIGHERELAKLARSEKLKGNRNAAKEPRGNSTANIGRTESPPSKPKGEHVTRKKAAKEAGVSTGTMQKAEALKAKAPEVFERVAAGEVKLNQAYRQLQRDEAIAKINSEPAPLHGGPFRVLVADPPWAYEKRKDDGTHRAALTYPDMTTDELCAMQISGRAVRDLGCEDSVLWLWTTNAFMRDAFRILDAWGFKEKTILTWAKNKMGTGDWLRGKSEHCILAVRGKPVVNLTTQTTLLEAPVREHSRKPDEFYALVDSLCPGSKCELFARETREGWTTWGAEQEKYDAGA